MDVLTFVTSIYTKCSIPNTRNAVHEFHTNELTAANAAPFGCDRKTNLFGNIRRRRERERDRAQAHDHSRSRAPHMITAQDHEARNEQYLRLKPFMQVCRT